MLKICSEVFYTHIHFMSQSIFEHCMGAHAITLQHPNALITYHKEHYSLNTLQSQNPQHSAEVWGTLMEGGALGGNCLVPSLHCRCTLMYCTVVCWHRARLLVADHTTPPQLKCLQAQQLCPHNLVVCTPHLQLACI